MMTDELGWRPPTGGLIVELSAYRTGLPDHLEGEIGLADRGYGTSHGTAFQPTYQSDLSLRSAALDTDIVIATRGRVCHGHADAKLNQGISPYLL